MAGVPGTGEGAALRQLHQLWVGLRVATVALIAVLHPGEGEAGGAAVGTAFGRSVQGDVMLVGQDPQFTVLNTLTSPVTT